MSEEIEAVEMLNLKGKNIPSLSFGLSLLTTCGAKSERFTKVIVIGETTSKGELGRKLTKEHLDDTPLCALEFHNDEGIDNLIRVLQELKKI